MKPVRFGVQDMEQCPAVSSYKGFQCSSLVYTDRMLWLGYLEIPWLGKGKDSGSNPGFLVIIDSMRGETLQHSPLSDSRGAWTSWQLKQFSTLSIYLSVL